MCRWSGDRRRGKGSGLLLIRQEAELVHPGRTNVVDDFDYPAELRPGVGLEKDPFIGPIRQLIFDLLRQIIHLDGVSPKEDLVISSDGNQQRVFLVGVVHIRGIIDLAMSTGVPCCNIGVTTMKMISSTSITSTIGVTLMSEVTLAASFRFANAMEFVSCVRLPQRGDHLMLLLLPKICSVESQARRPSP